MSSVKKWQVGACKSSQVDNSNLIRIQEPRNKTRCQVTLKKKHTVHLNMI